MPTPDWRYEKSASIVKALCQLLQTELTDEQRGEVRVALHDSLKLVCDSITEGEPKRGDLWTSAVVVLFVDQPEACDRWLELLDDPDFTPERYAKKH